MILVPNIQLFGAVSNELLTADNSEIIANAQGPIVRCTLEVYQLLCRNNHINDNSLYFVSYNSGAASSDINISTMLYMGRKLIGNSGVVFVEATNGFILLGGNKISLSTPTDLTNALPGVPGQILFVVNHSTDEQTQTEQYNTFMYVWSQNVDKNNKSNTTDGEWVNANINYTLTGLESIGTLDLEFVNKLPLDDDAQINTFYTLPADLAPEDINASDKVMYIYDPVMKTWAAISGGVGRDSKLAQSAHFFNDYNSNISTGRNGNTFNENGLNSGRDSNTFGFGGVTTGHAAMTNGVNNFNYGLGGFVTGFNNTVGLNFYYISKVDFNENKLYLSGYNQQSALINLKLNPNPQYIYLTDKNSIYDNTPENNELWRCVLLDYNEADGYILVESLNQHLKLSNSLTEIIGGTESELEHTNVFAVSDLKFKAFQYGINSGGSSIPNILLDDFNNVVSDDLFQGSANVVGGNDNYITGTSNIVVGSNLLAHNSNAAYFGRYNIDEFGALFILGDGTDNDNRSNAFIIHGDGSADLKCTGPNLTSVMTRSGYQSELDKLETQSFLIYKAGSERATNSSANVHTTAVIFSDTETEELYSLQIKGGQLFITPGSIIEPDPDVIVSKIQLNDNETYKPYLMYIANGDLILREMN